MYGYKFFECIPINKGINMSTVRKTILLYISNQTIYLTDLDLKNSLISYINSQNSSITDEVFLSNLISYINTLSFNDNNFKNNLLDLITTEQNNISLSITKKSVIDFINSTYNVNLNPATILISPPTSIIDNSYNTSIVVTDITNFPETSTKIVKYNRTDIATVLNQKYINFSLSNFTLLSQLIPFINTEYNINIVSTDYTDTTLPPVSTVSPYISRKVTLAINQNSYFYTGFYGIELNPLADTYIPANTTFSNFYIYIAGYSLSDIKKSLIAIDHTGVLIPTFGFLSNATVIETFTVVNVIQLSDKIVFNGTFNLTALISSNLVVITASSITIDLNGSIILFNSSPLFVNQSSQYYPVIPINLYCYALDLLPANTNKSVIRFTLDGIQDLSFSINLNYNPEFIRITDTGLIYSISRVALALNPYTNQTTNLVRIDRFLSTGFIDNTFTTVYISPLTVIDISPLDNNGLYVFVQPLDGLGPNSTIPLVNGVSIIPHNSQFKSLGTWEPIIHILEDGTYDTNYIQSIEPVSYTTVYDYTANKINVGNKLLFSDTSGVTLFTYKQNQITLLEFIQPIRFDRYGNIVYYSGNEYNNLFNWGNLEKLIQNEDNSIVGYGNVITLSESNNVTNQSVCLYNKDGTPNTILYSVPQTIGLQLSINSIFSFNKTITTANQLPINQPINLNSEVTGILNPVNGGLGISNPIGYLKGNGLNPVITLKQIPYSDISGLTDLITQNEANVLNQAKTYTDSSINNLNNVAQAITALNLGTAATHAATDFATPTTVSSAITSLNLGTAATHAATDFDSAGSAANAISTAETFTTNAITSLNLGTAATHAATDFTTPTTVSSAITSLNLGTAATHAATDFATINSVCTDSNVIIANRVFG